MAPLIARTEGFITDVLSKRVAARPEHHHHHVLVMLAVLFILALIMQLSVFRADKAKEANTVGSQPTSISNNCTWRVHYLNETNRVLQVNGTSFAFNPADPPLSFISILFGDFRNDIAHASTYYGGCGFLVNASGTNGSITLAEAGGKQVSSVSYLGQSMIVFSGERRSVSYPNESTSYHGTDQIALDWSNGTWSPDQGILVKHSSNVSLSSSVFCLTALELAGGREIPEFEILPVIIACCLIVPLTIRRRSR